MSGGVIPTDNPNNPDNPDNPDVAHMIPTLMITLIYPGGTLRCI